MTKADLRREMRRRLQSLGAERAEKSRAIVAAIAAHPAFVRSEQVALFAPLPGEPDIEELWKSDPRIFHYPRVAGEQIEFVPVARRNDLVPSAWNARVREPAETVTGIIVPADIKLILVPGLAFTRDGQRLGRGGGFYDRFLAQLPAHAVKLGVCFDLQMVAELPAELHDQRVDAVITESGLVPSSD
jgi:5-formyltetrahydrofolate cyclo-ligase